MEERGQEQRRFVRAKFPCKIIISAPQERIFSSYTENIGAGGVRVLLEERLDISDFVGLEIYLAEEPIVCKGRVVWVVQKGNTMLKANTRFDTGIEFFEISGGDQAAITNIVNALIAKGK